MSSQINGPNKVNGNIDGRQWIEFPVPIELVRDGVQSPWGFRLRGGSDVEGGTPLEIIKVFVGGACEGVLQVGDKIISINDQNAEQISHFEAQHIFKTSGTSVRLHVVRFVQCDTRNISQHFQYNKFQDMNKRPFSPQAVFNAPQPIQMQESQQNQAFKNSPTSSFTSPAISQSSNQQSYLHLPSPKDSTFSKPHESETFKIIMSEEIAHAKNQTGISAKKFSKSHSNSTRPLSQLSDNSDESNKSQFDPVLKNTSINQSTSFKKLMNAVMGETEF